jgi:hypothetical protein
MAMDTPSQCHLWHKKNLTPSDIQLTGNFAILKTFVEESHFMRRLVQCQDCGQLYFYQFTEEIDWEKGQDAQYRTFIPATSEHEVEKLNTRQPDELLQIYPRLQSDWPSNTEEPKVSWIGK